MVSGDTSGSDPVGNKEDGLGGGSSRNSNAHILTYPEEVSRDHSPRTVGKQVARVSQCVCCSGRENRL